MRAVLLVTAAAATTFLVVTSPVVFQPAQEDTVHHDSAAAPSSTESGSATPDPRNTPPPASPTPQPLEPPPVGPYRPREHEEQPPSTRATGLEDLSRGARRLIRDVDSGRLSAAQFTRIALAKMGYGRGVPDRYRGEVNGFDLTALSLAVDAVDPDVPPAERARIRREVLDYVHGADPVERPADN